MTRKKVLITGASGFIGKALCRDLAHEHEVIAVTRQPHSALLKNGITVHSIQDVFDSNQWKSLLKGVDVVVHLIGKAHDLSTEDKKTIEEYYRINVELTRLIAEAAIQSGVSQFIYLSSIKVNGNCSDTAPDKKFNEQLEPKPVDIYGKTKYEAEKVLLLLAKDSSLKMAIVRPPLIYGPGVKANFEKLITLVNKKIPLPFKKINNQRSFIYIGNLISLIKKLIEEENTSGVFLVSDNEDVSTPELIKKIADVLHQKAHLWTFPLSLLYFLARFCRVENQLKKLTESLAVDCQSTLERLKWHPPYTMTEGLKETLK